MKDLEPFVGEWNLEARFEHLEMPEGDSGARVVFEWLTGGQFLVERWEIPIPEAPDGIAIIGADPDDEGGYLQHYFDSRGVARVYKMRFDGRVWTLSREAPDFSPLDFKQRFSGTFSDDGRQIDCTWEICEDGETWEKDFDLTYTKS
jgi:hypothetical protein